MVTAFRARQSDSRAASEYLECFLECSRGWRVRASPVETCRHVRPGLRRPRSPPAAQVLNPAEMESVIAIEGSPLPILQSASKLWDEPRRELLGNPVANGFQIERQQMPMTHLLQSLNRQRCLRAPFFDRIVGQLLNNSGGNPQRIPAFLVALPESVSKILFDSEIEQNIAIERELFLLPLYRHK